MKVIPAELSLALYFALTLESSRADSDVSGESNEHSTKLFSRISSLLDRTDKNYVHYQYGPGLAPQPYPYPYFGYPYYIRTNGIQNLPAPPGVPQPMPAANPFLIGYPTGITTPNYLTYSNYPANPNVPAYNPYLNAPTQASPSKHNRRHHHSSQEDLEERDYTRGRHERGNGLSSEYQDAGHYIGQYQGRPLGGKQ